MSNPFADYRLTSPFGYRIHPVYGTKKFHKGVDLVTTPSIGPIYAFVAGEVTHAKEGVTGSGFGGYGIVVAIKDDKGYLHCYAHLSATVVKVGQKVERGQMIGRQGSTGVSTGPHLHYEIRKKCSPSYGYTESENGVVEPTKYLQYYYYVPVKDVKPVTDNSVKVVANGEQVADVIVIAGVTYVPLRALGNAIGATVGWNKDTNTATLTTK